MIKINTRRNSNRQKYLYSDIPFFTDSENSEDYEPSDLENDNKMYSDYFEYMSDNHIDKVIEKGRWQYRIEWHEKTVEDNHGDVVHALCNADIIIW